MRHQQPQSLVGDVLSRQLDADDAAAFGIADDRAAQEFDLLDRAPLQIARDLPANAQAQQNRRQRRGDEQRPQAHPPPT
jgi:hypothetical protein